MEEAQELVMSTRSSSSKELLRKQWREVVADLLMAWTDREYEGERLFWIARLRREFVVPVARMSNRGGCRGASQRMRGRPCW